jgi:hypothetical protein
MEGSGDAMEPPSPWPDRDRIIAASLPGDSPDDSAGDAGNDP